MYSKYFKMLKVGLPKEAVQAKMRQEGVDPDMLDKSPDEMISLNPKPSVDDGPKVPANEHPKYAKYFKMVNFGVPKPVVTMKFQQETGLDPALLDTPEAAAPPGGEEADGDGSDGE